MKKDQKEIFEYFENILSIEEYNLLYEGHIYKFSLMLRKSDFNLKCGRYEINFSPNNILTLSNNNFKSIDEAFQCLNEKFENNKIKIETILEKKGLIIYFFLDPDEFSTKQEYYLEYNTANNYSILNEMFVNNKKFLNYAKTFESEIYNELTSVKSNYSEQEKMKDDITKIKTEITEMNKTSETMSSTLRLNLNTSKQRSENPKNISYSKDIITNSFANYSNNNSFTVYLSIDKIQQLIYSTKNKSIVKYNITDDKKEKEIFKAHESYITSLKHFYDHIKNRDLIMSISKKDNNLKIWNAWNLDNICNIPKVNSKFCLYSACFLEDANDNFIVTSNGCSRDSYSSLEQFEPLKVYNLSGNNILSLEKCNDCTYYVDSYYDEKIEKNYIITGNYGYIKSFDFDKSSLYHKYFDNSKGIHNSVIVNSHEEKIKMIDSCEDGIIRIWEFHSAKLLRKISVVDNILYGICLWNSNYIFVGCKDQSIKLIELTNGLSIKELKGHKGRVISIMKSTNTNGKDYLISQSLDNKIKLWIEKERNKN